MQYMWIVYLHIVMCKTVNDSLWCFIFQGWYVWISNLAVCWYLLACCVPWLIIVFHPWYDKVNHHKQLSDNRSQAKFWEPSCEKCSALNLSNLTTFFLIARDNININDVLGDYMLTLVDSLDTLAVVSSIIYIKFCYRKTKLSIPGNSHTITKWQ